MTALALVTTGKVNVAEAQIRKTLPLGETLVVGDAVRQDASTGKWTGANGTTTTENRIWGVLVSVDEAGAVGTAVRKGLVDGFDLSAMNYDAPVYLSDTDKKLDTAAGTVSTVVGRVESGPGTTLGTAADKLLRIDL